VVNECLCCSVDVHSLTTRHLKTAAHFFLFIVQIERCLMCDKVRKAATLHRNKSVQPLNGSTSTTGYNSSSQKASTSVVGSAQKAKFSFLHRVSANTPAQYDSIIGSNDRRFSAPGRIGQQDFLSFSNSTNSAGGRLGSIFSPINKSTPRGNSLEKPVSEFNLLELERTNKKKRRRTLGPTTSQK